MEQGVIVMDGQRGVTFRVGDRQEKPWFRDNHFKFNVVAWKLRLFIRGDDMIDIDVPPATAMVIDDFDADAFAFPFMDIPKFGAERFATAWFDVVSMCRPNDGEHIRFCFRQ